MTNKRPLIVVFVIVGALSLLGAYNYVSSIAYANGKKDGAKSATANMVPAISLTAAELEYEKLQDDYNALVTDYNELRDAAVQYVDTTNYKSATIRCTTFNNGLTGNSNTTCY